MNQDICFLSQNFQFHFQNFIFTFFRFPMKPNRDPKKKKPKTKKPSKTQLFLPKWIAQEAETRILTSLESLVNPQKNPSETVHV